MYLFLPVVLLGQLAMSVAAVNRLHSLGYPRWVLKAGDCLCYVVTASLPIAVAIWFLQNNMRAKPAERMADVPPWVLLYLTACSIACIAFIGTRIYQNRWIRTTPRLLTNHTRVFDVRKRLGYTPTQQAFTTFCAHLPWNEIFQLSVREKRIQMPTMDPGLNGLRITHLSDLHMTGQLAKPFYEQVVQITNQSESDLVVITGDIVEKVRCLDWIADTLGALKAIHGVCFVLGNHEHRIADETRLRKTLTDAGLIDLGSTWKLITHADRPILLGGNELPWYGPAVDFSDAPAAIEGVRPLRILLTHSPDQLAWARANDCDLMLAGHTHGGQVRLPWIGPILAPSRFGTRFASGTFYYQPTLMHVSRGIAGTRPLRLNCQPEIARLVLQSDRSADPHAVGEDGTSPN